MTQEVSENRKRKYDGTLTATTPKKKRQEPPQKSIFDKKIRSQYVTKKTSLKSIVCDEATSSEIKSVVIRMHELAIRTYQFIRLFCLHKFENGNTLPVTDEEFVRYCIMAVGASPTRGRKPKKTELLDELKQFYVTEFEECLGNEPEEREKLDLTHLSYNYNYLATQISTVLATNVKTHFLHRLRQFVNYSARA